VKPLATKTALITGSSSGIGAGLAGHFAQAGANVIVNYRRNEEGARRTAEEVRKAEVEALIVQADVGIASEVERLFHEVDEHFGRLDVLVNNAGITIKVPLLQATEEQFDQTIQTNLKSVFLCSQEAARRMRKSGGGAILNISSTHAAQTTYSFGVYAASKGALEAFTRSAAIEWGPYGIRVNALRVGFIQVERDSIPPDDPTYELVCRRIPVGRPGEVAEVGPLALLLCSPQASFVTGAVLEMDGGQGAMLNTPFDSGYVKGAEKD